jgi:hypothetical protein
MDWVKTGGIAPNAKADNFEVAAKGSTEGRIAKPHESDSSQNIRVNPQ